MNKPTRKIVAITDIRVDLDLNIRQINNYDLPSMMEQIISAGRIIKPIIVRAEDMVVLSGNRRTLAGQKLFNDPTCPSEVKESLKKVDVILYSGLNPQEELQLIIDHGSEKPISRTEVVHACWRLDKQFFSEVQIIQLLYFALAAYSGNTKKLAEVPSEPKSRSEFLRKWLHGTVGNYILAAAKMGEFVRQQFVLTHKSEDKLLTSDEKVEVRMSRDRITQLSAARTADSKSESGWTPDKGGVAFNELLEKFKREDTGEEAKERTTRPSSKDLKDKADVFKASAIRKALLIAAGVQGDQVKGLVEDDDRMYRSEQVDNLLVKYGSNIKDATMRDFVGVLLHGTPVQVEERLKSLCEVVNV